MSLFRKFFFKKPPDGLLEISERVYVFDYCFAMDVLEEGEFKEYVGGIIRQLHDHFPDASFMDFNFREGDNESQIASILCEYDMTVVDYPREYEGCPLLTMEMIHHYLRSGESWLQLGQQNVLLMHCERSRWPVLAFMLAALLIYRNQYTGEQKTLDMIYKQANPELLQLMSPLNPLPSQLRYLQYISRRNLGSQWPPLDRALTLDCVIIRFIPNMDEEGGCRPIFRIYGPDPLMAADRTSKVLFSTPKRSKLARNYKQADCELAKIDIHCHVQGDVVLECINLGDDLEREQMIFRVIVNTAFIRSNILMLNRDEIDILWNIANDHFAKDFRVEVLFSDMDVSSVNSIDLPCIEDKEGLSVEAFAKVQEIFSNDDWLDSKTEVANVLQQIKVSNILLERLESGVSATTSSLLKESLSGKLTLEPKRLLENDIKNLASNVQGKPSNSSFESSVETSPEKKIEPLELKTSSENNIRSPASIGPGKQCVTLVGLSMASNILPEKLDNGVPTTTSNSPKESLSGKFELEPKKPPGIDMKNLASKFQGIASVSSFQSSFDTSPNQKIETTVSKASSESNIKSPASIGSGKHTVPSTGLLTDSDSNKMRIESLESKAKLMDQGKQSTPLIEPAIDENMIKKKSEPLEPTMSENDIKSPTSSVQLKQSVPSFQPAIDANSIKKKIEPQELQVVLQFPAQSKIISPRVHQASRSPPVLYCTSLQGSPVPISRYQSAPSVLGITALLQDHLVMDAKEEVTHTIAGPPSSTVSPSVSKVPRSIEPSSSCIPPALLPSLSLKSSLDASTAVEKTVRSIALTTAATPPPPCPPQLHQSIPKLMQSVVIQHQEITMHERSQKSTVSPPLPPPPSPPGATKSSFATPPPKIPASPLPPTPTSSSLKSSFSTPPLSPSAKSQTFSFPGKSPDSIVKDSIITQPPPPPPPLLPQISTDQTLFSTSPSPPPSESMNNSAIISVPPPPPRYSGITSNPVSSSVPPPPPLPNSASRNSLSKNCTTVPPVPPPSPYPNGLSKSDTAPPQSPPNVGNGNVPPPVPGPPSGVPFGAKGRGPLRANPKSQTQTKRSNLKPYHWLKLTRVVQGSLWAETQKLDDASKAPEFDMSELESLFSAVVPNSDHGRKGGKSNRRASRPKAGKVQLIELRRAYNCEIMLSKVKTRMPDLMSSVLALDDSALDIDQIENLIKFCPTKEEMELLKGYNGDKDNLGKCEQFFLELMKVPRVQMKLRVFSFKIQFFSQVSELRRDLNIVNFASEEIRNSVKLKRIMQTILSLGNALNHGTARGSAVGFRLDSLLKLTDTRARNNKMTLMHYLCKVLAEKLPELLDFPKDLVSLEDSTKIQLKYLAEEMQAISKGLEKVVQELTASENDGPVSENFCKILKEFLSDAEAEVRSLVQLYSNVGRNADALTLYFGEDPARCPFEQVVSTLHNFVKMFVRAHEENCKQLEFERKRAEKEAEQEKLKLAS